MSKKKKMTLRQRLRAQAAEKLADLERTMWAAAERVVGEHDTDVSTLDLMRYCSSTQNATVANDLITQLANEQEAKLEAFFNNQEDLTFGSKESDDAD